MQKKTEIVLILWKTLQIRNNRDESFFFLGTFAEQGFRNFPPSPFVPNKRLSKGGNGF